MVALAALALLSPYGHDHYISLDGGWCWFADPRAMWVDGKIVSGGVSQSGDVFVTEYDPRTKAARKTVLAEKFEKDDHANPSFLRLTDGRIAAFYSKHTGPDLWMRETVRASDVTAWTPPRRVSPNDPAFHGPAGALNAYCYPNPCQQSAEHGRIYLFWRGMNWKPTLSWSDDQGKTWVKGRIVVTPASQDPENRPYVKVASDGRSKIHVAFTDGHPRNEPANSVYYAGYEKGAFRRADGSVIRKIEKLPFEPSEADVVYDGRTEGVRAWVWDVKADKSGRPVIAYVRLPLEDRHIYHYARWNGRRWVDRKIVEAGGWFPQTPAGKKEPEPHYSGGLCLDPDDTRFVYLSRKVGDRFEVERWFTPDGGDSWSHVAITGESKHDSVRPFVPAGRPAGVGPVALWLNMNRYVHYTDYAGTQQAADEDRGPWSADGPARAMKAVWQWARSNPSSYEPTEWTMAPLYIGLLDYSARPGAESARDWVAAQADKAGWRLGARASMADDQAVGQAYLQLYEAIRDPRALKAVKEWGDQMLARSFDESLEWKGGISNREWAWCDSLFMAPPTLAWLAKVTGERRYLELMAKLWWKTSSYLYDPAEHLFYRDSRYFSPREANGKKVFWSRGNGWVLAGLARVIQQMEPSDPLRPSFVEQFRAMAARIAALQTPDGTWHSSLLDPDSYPSRETSGTGFYCYALAWGVQSGVLDRAEFAPVVRRSFKALIGCIDPNGRLGWVQPVGQDPKKVKDSDTDTFGVGAFLMAACQVEQMEKGG